MCPRDTAMRRYLDLGSRLPIHILRTLGYNQDRCPVSENYHRRLKTQHRLSAGNEPGLGDRLPTFLMHNR